MLDDRAKSVADTLDQADERLADAEKQKAEYTQQLADARGEASRIIEEARKRALDDAVVYKQIDRLGTTEYFLNSLRFEHDENVMVPMSEMTEARRMACEALDAARLEAFAPARKPVHRVTEQLVPNAHKVRNCSVWLVNTYCALRQREEGQRSAAGRSGAYPFRWRLLQPPAADGGRLYEGGAARAQGGP